MIKTLIWILECGAQRDMGHRKRRYKKNWKPSICGHGEEWRKSVGRNITEMKKCRKGLEQKEP